MKSFTVYTTEAFDNPLSYIRNRSIEKDLSNVLSSVGVNYFEIYESQLGNDTIRFYLFLVNGKHYEIHFSNSANDHETIALGNIYKNNQLTRIIATALDIVISKLKDKTTPVLIYEDTKRKTDLYMKAIKTKYPSVFFQPLTNVKGIDGSIHPHGFFVKPDKRTFKLENVIKAL